MVATKVLLSLALGLCAHAAPQLPPQAPAHEYAYGVQTDQGDVKEHKQVTDNNGRQEGEYKWLMPDGLFKVVRWSVQGDSGFVAQVSEEPGQRAVGNYYFNSLTGEGTGQAPVTIIRADPQPTFTGPTIIDGGVIDGGIIDGGFINSRTVFSSNDDSDEDSSVFFG